MKCKVYALRKRYVIGFGFVPYTRRIVDISEECNGDLKRLEEKFKQLRNTINDDYTTIKIRFWWVWKSNKRPTMKTFMKSWYNRNFDAFTLNRPLSISAKEKLHESAIEVELDIQYLIKDIKDNWEMYSLREDKYILAQVLWTLESLLV